MPDPQISNQKTVSNSKRLTVALVALGTVTFIQLLFWLNGLSAEAPAGSTIPPMPVLMDSVRLMLMDSMLVFAPGALLIYLGLRRKPQVLVWVGLVFMLFGLARTAAFTLA